MPEPGDGEMEIETIFIGSKYKEEGSHTGDDGHPYRWSTKVDLENLTWESSDNDQYTRDRKGFCKEGTPKTTEIYSK